MAKAKFKDPRGGHCRVYWDILDSPAWAALQFSSQAIYMAARRRLTANSNGDIAITLNYLSERGVTDSSSTLANALRELLAVGLIAVTR
jgi:hypothetical protein